MKKLTVVIGNQVVLKADDNKLNRQKIKNLFEREDYELFIF